MRYALQFTTDDPRASDIFATLFDVGSWYVSNDTDDWMAEAEFDDVRRAVEAERDLRDTLDNQNLAGGWSVTLVMDVPDEIIAHYARGRKGRPVVVV